MDLEPGEIDETRRGPRGRALALGLLVAALGVLPYALQTEIDFASDDVLMISRGRETGILEGARRWFTEPWLEAPFVRFYRPLYGLAFTIEARLFGAEPRPYYLENVLLQGLAIFLGFLVSRRLLGARWAALGALVWGLSPWVVNNVAWIVGRSSSLGTVFVFLAVLAYLRHVDRGRRGPPWAATALVLVGVFWRETALFAPVLCCLFDLLEGRRDRRALGAWVLLGFPFVLYLACRLAVLGTLGGGYAPWEALAGPLEAAGPALEPASWGRALLLLVAPDDGLGSGGFDATRIVGLAALVAALAAALAGWRRLGGATLLLAAFAAAHAVPLLVVDPVLHGGSSQRWHLVLWALFAAIAGGARAAPRRLRPLAGLALLLLAACFGSRTVEWVEDYAASGRFTRSLRAAIAEAPESTVVVHGVRPYHGVAPHFETGLGQLSKPPFGDGRKAIFPVAFEARWLEGDPRALTPLAAALLARGEALAPLWCDFEGGRVDRIPEDLLVAAAGRLAELPRIELRIPGDGRPDLLADPEASMFVEAPTIEDGPLRLGRLDLHLLTPLAEILLVRRVGERHLRESPWERGGRPAPAPADAVFDGLVLEQAIRPLADFGRFAPGGAEGRFFLWAVGYADGGRDRPPCAVSEIVELRVRADDAP